LWERDIIERMFGWLKENCRVVARFDHRVMSYAAMVTSTRMHAGFELLTQGLRVAVERRSLRPVEAGLDLITSLWLRDWPQRFI
jgi:hypothetical protein